MPPILTIGYAPDPVLYVVLSRTLSFLPSVTGQLPVVRMDGLQPSEPATVRI
jgi:hypothetical protein